MKAVLGKKQDNRKFQINIESLIETRMLIQANSGGGKSYAIRKLLEVTHPFVQQIVLDPEGEFATLREKFDYVLIGPEGDVNVDPKSAKILARKLMDLNVSAIIDMSELKKHKRVEFVKNFLDALMELPKKYWHPLLVVLDEAHEYCAQKEKRESTGSVIDLSTRGRKRGFAGVIATQRISKLHKDCAAELNNKLIGRTGLDIDMKRVADELGFSSKEQTRSLRDLEPGEFYCFGPSLTRSVEKVMIDKVVTTHIRPGTKLDVKEMPPASKIKRALSKMTEMDKQAAEELKNVEDYKKKIRSLKTELRMVKSKSPNMVNPDLLKKTQHEIKVMTRNHNQEKRELEKQYKQIIITGQRRIGKLNTMLRLIGRTMNDYSKNYENLEPVKIPEMKVLTPKFVEFPQNPLPKIVKKEFRLPKTHESSNIDSDEKLPVCPRKIYSMLYANPDRAFSRPIIGVLTGYRHTSGGFSNALSLLNSKDLIIREGKNVRVNQDNLRDDLIDNADYSIRTWLDKLGVCPSKILALLLQDPEREFTREEIGEETGYRHTSGGFSNAISRLNSTGLIKRTNGNIKINEEIIEFL